MDRRKVGHVGHDAGHVGSARRQLGHGLFEDRTLDVGKHELGSPTGQDLWRTLVVRGSPKLAPSAMAQGVTLSKRYYAADGTELDPTELSQNRRFIVVLDGKATDAALHRMAVTDLLPAGWEIESPIRRDKAPGFLGPLSKPQMQEGRDDRYVAAFEITQNGKSYRRWIEDEEADKDAPPSGTFRLAYAVRAITPGSYTLPEAVVEDMYRPGTMARTAAGQARVVAR